MSRAKMIIAGVVAAVALVVLAAAVTWWLKPTPSTNPAASAPTAAAPTVTVTPLSAQPGPDTTTPASTEPPAGSEIPPEVSVPPYPSGEPASKSAAARRRWLPVAVGFAKHFTAVPKAAESGQSRTARWKAGLDPYVTADLGRQLDTVDIGNVPDGTYAAAEAVDYGEDQVVVQIDYDAGDAGWSLVLDISTRDRGATWRVNRYDRQELG